MVGFLQWLMPHQPMHVSAGVAASSKLGNDILLTWENCGCHKYYGVYFLTLIRYLFTVSHKVIYCQAKQVRHLSPYARMPDCESKWLQLQP